MEANSKTDCPVCGKSFPSSFINTHVNECLNLSNVESTEDDTMSKSNKRKSSDRSEDKGWGFFRQRSVSKKAKLSESTKTKSKQELELKESDKTNYDSDDDVSILINDDDDQHSVKSPKFKTSATTHQTSNIKDIFHSSIPNRNSSSSSSHSNTTQAKPSSSNSSKNKFAPLAERMRPISLDKYVGQTKAVGRDSLLHSLLQGNHIPSMVLWGPPGCGKTTLARIIANNCKSHSNVKFVQLSAAAAGISDVKQVVTVAKNDQKMFKKKTILFLDEIHRFNKTQQDTLLPHVEDGTLTLIGATTENPSFQVNGALLSRCRVIVLDKLTTEDLCVILYRAVEELGGRVFESQQDIEDSHNAEDHGDSPPVWVEKNAITTLANLCDGDARASLNGLQMAVQSRVNSSKFASATQSNGDANQNIVIVNTDHVKEGLQRSHVLYDRTGEEHYNIISAMHKSIRGSDANAALYWLARMLEGGENPLYVARRLVRLASEDIGLADPLALNQAVAAYQACHFIGMPECDVILAQCVVYMARAPKSVEIYKAYKNAKSSVREHQGPLPSVPLHLRNAPTKLMKSLDYGKGYKYNPDYSEPVDQEYFPEELKGTDFFT
ncbi:LOW QUALITY PROTEIN: ATPase WRNIP1-like [Haliotis rubra]|uniref:LOW QUALITY PROTEIN: ATPase WRNIP1-like n=1 Tax=Haliotis rubra TaxID=36100 RepID=UPI001EE5FDE4|nr:LOW QUALITY PROTEIN: ATPase WRNIP1-like [Haliotis rubra]